jgi:hypothetical protein
MCQIVIVGLVLAGVLGVISYLCLAFRIREFMELEMIITWLDF